MLLMRLAAAKADAISMRWDLCECLTKGICEKGNTDLDQSSTIVLLHCFLALLLGILPLHWLSGSFGETHEGEDLTVIKRRVLMTSKQLSTIPATTSAFYSSFHCTFQLTIE